MTADSRYPNMHPIDGRYLPGAEHHDAPAITRWASSVASRAGVHPWWNQARRCIHFCLRPSCEVAVTRATVYGPGGMLLLQDQDAVCQRIYTARAPARKKDAELRQAEKDEKDAADAAWHRDLDSSRAERLKDARRSLRLRESGGTSRPMVTV